MEDVTIPNNVTISCNECGYYDDTIAEDDIPDTCPICGSDAIVIID